MMPSPGRLLTALLLTGLLLCGGWARAEQHWSSTSPQINLRHIFQGEINRHGKPTGFHSRPGGRDPEDAYVVHGESPPNRVGVYTARVAVRDGRDGPWREKFSSFFPDQFDREQVVAAILHAWRHRESGKEQPWRGPSGHGFDIQGYLGPQGGIQTAFPVYRKDRSP
jgi:hypothetical protein